MDLTPLSQCNNLELLDTSKNRLKEVDLSPLAGCKKLKKLNLDGNRIKELDTSPLDNIGYVDVSW